MKSFNISRRKGLNRKELYTPLVLFSGGGKSGRTGKYWAIDLVLLLVAIAKTRVFARNFENVMRALMQNICFRNASWRDFTSRHDSSLQMTIKSQ